MLVEKDSASSIGEVEERGPDRSVVISDDRLDAREYCLESANQSKEHSTMP